VADVAPILAGLRVVEAATFVFGPAAGTVLADFGADVVKIEHPVTGDPYRYLPQLKPLPECARNYCWLLDSRSKRSIALDLKREAGREAALALVRRADVFITNYHPSVLAALHLRWEDLRPENARLVYAHATGYGEAGPELEKPGYDATAWWARSGLMDAVRPAGGELGLATPGMGDHPSALALFGGILLALYARERSGRGTKVSSSLLANGAWANGIYLQAALCGAEPYRAPTHAGSPNALVNHYRTADGRSLYLAMVQEAREWEHFCTAIGRPELRGDPRFAELPARRANAPALTAILDEVFASRPLAAWRAALDRHGVTFGIVARTHDLPDDPQMEANGVFAAIEGAEGLRTVASPIALEGAPKVPPRVAPELGEHTREVLAELGYAREAIQALLESGAARAAAG
jgi:formyl-CoA transferase